MKVSKASFILIAAMAFVLILPMATAQGGNQAANQTGTTQQPAGANQTGTNQASSNQVGGNQNQANQAGQTQTQVAMNQTNASQTGNNQSGANQAGLQQGLCSNAMSCGECVNIASVTKSSGHKSFCKWYNGHHSNQPGWCGLGGCVSANNCGRYE